MIVVPIKLSDHNETVNEYTLEILQKIPYSGGYSYAVILIDNPRRFVLADVESKGLNCWRL